METTNLSATLTLTMKSAETTVELGDREADAMAWLMNHPEELGHILRTVYRENV